MSSTVEAELGALFINAKLAVPMQIMLEELGHSQPPTPTQTDKFDNTRGTHKPNQSKSNKSNGYAILVASRSRDAGPISFLLATGNVELGRLLDETSSSCPPCEYEIEIIDVADIPRPFHDTLKLALPSVTRA